MRIGSVLAFVVLMTFGGVAIAQSNDPSQDALNKCLAMIRTMQDTSTSGTPALCGRLEELKLVCNQVQPGMGDSQVIDVGRFCDGLRLQQREADAAQARTAEEKRLQNAQRQPSAPQPQSAAALREQVLSALPVLLRQSITRTSISPETLAALIKLSQQLGEAYIEKKKGSVLAYTSNEDTAIADAGGYKRRESDNFVVFYGPGDMNRAITTLKDAEASIDPITAFLHHFPSILPLPSRRSSSKAIVPRSRKRVWFRACTKVEAFRRPISPLSVMAVPKKRTCASPHISVQSSTSSLTMHSSICLPPQPQVRFRGGSLRDLLAMWVGNRSE
jgi:hypothetical protein